MPPTATDRPGLKKLTDEEALITGITGQDGSYLAEPSGKGYEVHGIVPGIHPEPWPYRASDGGSPREEAAFYLYYGDLSDSVRCCTSCSRCGPTKFSTSLPRAMSR
jgi:GDPmannose 4,6-dehydratase